MPGAGAGAAGRGNVVCERYYVMPLETMGADILCMLMPHNVGFVPVFQHLFVRLRFCLPANALPQLSPTLFIFSRPKKYIDGTSILFYFSDSPPVQINIAYYCDLRTNALPYSSRLFYQQDL